MSSTLNVPEIFGSDVFNESVMKERLRPEIFNAWKQCIENSTPLELSVANEIAEAMKAKDRGLPLGGVVAPQLDSQ